ncbi:MAG: hypothetical protein EA379_07350 [Phycisphaerales bacterium]|nr:MAG: hypothetical protein EA379_07350 [Phycisphaerales bacterium]
MISSLVWASVACASAPFEGQIRFDHPDALEHRFYPSFDSEGPAETPGVGPSPCAGEREGWSAARFAIEGGAPGLARSTLRYNMSHVGVGQNGRNVSGGLGSTTSTHVLRWRGALCLPDMPPSLSGANRHRVFELMRTSAQTLVSLEFERVAGETRARVFLLGAGTVSAPIPSPYGAPGGAPGSPPGGVEIEVLYVGAGSGSSGDLRLWIDGVEVEGVRRAGHGVTHTVSSWRFGATRIGASNADAIVQYLLAARWSNDADAVLTLDAMTPAPGSGRYDIPGAFIIRDRAHDRAVVQTTLPPGQFGFEEIHAAARFVSWPEGPPPPNPAPAALTPEQGHTVNFLLEGLSPGASYGVEIAWWSDAQGADERVSRVYTVRTHQAPGERRTILHAAPFCSQQDGYSAPYGFDALMDVLDSADPDADVLITEHEDWVYFDNRDAAAPYSHEFAALVGVARQRWADAGSHRMLSTHGSRRGWGDHHFHNNFVPSWQGDMRPASPPYNAPGVTRHDVWVESRKFIERIELPGFLDTPAAGVDYRAVLLGRTLFVHLNTIEYSTSGSMFGAEQLAWLRGVLQSTDAEFVCLVAPFVLSDVIWKAGQDCEENASWRAERHAVFSDIESNPSVRAWWIVEGDSHLGYVSTRFRTHYDDPVTGAPRRYPKHLFAACIGAISNNGVTATTTTTEVNVPPQNPNPGLLAGAASKPGVQWLSIQEEPVGAFDAFQQPAVGPPAYTRMFGLFEIDQEKGSVRVRAYDASRYDSPEDRMLFDGEYFAAAAPLCPGDTNGDGVIDFADLATVLGAFGDQGEGLPADVNNDGVVDFGDLSIVLAQWGVECENE